LFNIIDYYFKQTSGIERFMRQFISIAMISVVFFTLFINVCRDYGVINFFLILRKVFFISFIIVFSCGIIEHIIVSYNLKGLIPLVELYNYLPFVDIKLDYRLARISSTTFEPPALGSYLITISGFMFSYIFTSKRRLRILPFLMVVVLALMTKSRTAFVIIFVQIAIGVYYSYYKYPKFRSLFTKGVLVGSVLGLFVVIFNGKSIASGINDRIEALDFFNNVDYNTSENAVSNKSRLGIQFAMFQVFKDSPIIGTGWGQHTFESRHYYPDWALKNNYEFTTRYLNEDLKSFPPGYNMYMRLLAETGIIGLCTFLFFLFIIVNRAFYYYKFQKSHNYIHIALIISFFGYILNWLQIDSFRLYGFWISLAILIMLHQSRNEKNNSSYTAL
jgi:O-antigen ligase